MSEMEAEASTAAPQQAASNVYIFDSIRSLQAQHGLKHGDYTRYRLYCSRRVAKLRTQVKFHHGRNRFQKKELKLEMIEDERWLEMLLLEAERAWAAAHEIKAQMDEDGSVNANKRRHMLRRFAKAHKQAQVLEAGCARIGGARRRTEAAAYVDLLAALELFERGHQVEIAAGHFIRARRALDALANVGPASSKSACRQKITEIESELRLCVHRAGQSAGRPVAEADLELERDEEIEGGIAGVRERLALPSDAAAAATSDAQSATFAWRGTKTPIQEAAVEVELARARRCEERLEEAAGMDVDGVTPAAAAAARAKTHDEAIAALSRAHALLADSLEASSSGAGEGVDAEAQAALLAAVSGCLAETVLLRHTLHAQTLNGRFKRNAARALSKSKDREKGARAEDCVRLYDALVKASLDLERAANLNGIAPAAAEALVARSEAFAALYAAARCYYIAHLRLAKRTPDDLATAQALFDSSRERLLASVESLKGGLPEEQAEIVEFLVTEAAAYALVAQADGAAIVDREDSQLAGGLQGMGLEGGSVSAAAGSEYLADQLQEWKSFVGSSGSQARIFKVSSLLQTIAMRPITLDTALQHIPEPDVSHRCRAKAPAEATDAPSVISGFKSLFGYK